MKTLEMNRACAAAHPYVWKVVSMVNKDFSIKIIRHFMWLDSGKMCIRDRL